MNHTLKELIKLADEYEGNLLNYFYGLSPTESKVFNKLVKENKNK